MKSNIIKYIAYYILKTIAFILMKLMCGIKAEGRENLPLKAPFIIAANHASFIDVPAIGLAIPVLMRWITRPDVYNIPYLKPIHEIFGSILVNGSTKQALDALKQNAVVGIFPEGTRTSDGKLKKANVGVAVLALKSGVPIVPVGLSGTFKAFPPNARFLRFHKVLVKIGKPIIFPQHNEDPIDNAMLRKTADQIMGKISELLVDI